MRDWVLLAIGIGLYDGYLLLRHGRSLSLAWWGWVAQPGSRWLCVLAWTLITAHLFLQRP
jgi:hypothetical protein